MTFTPDPLRQESDAEIMKIIKFAAEENQKLKDEIRHLKFNLAECDDILAHLEDFTHGEDGVRITKLRGKIQKIYNS